MREVATSDWLVVTQDRIDAFADATGDHQWIHVDTERARTETPFGATIAHGFLTLSLLSALMRDAVTVDGPRMTLNYGLNRVRFVSPVPSGSRVRARIALGSTEDKGRQHPGDLERHRRARRRGQARRGRRLDRSLLSVIRGASPLGLPDTPSHAASSAFPPPREALGETSP